MRIQMIQWVVVLAALSVAGCKMNLRADIYTADVMDAAAGTAGLVAPAKLALQVPDIEECDKHTSEIEAIMAGVVSHFAPKGCERADMESYLVADIRMPIVTSEAEWKASDALFGVLIREQEDGLGVGIGMKLSKYGVLTSRMKEKFHQTVDIADSRVIVVLNHDEREAARVAVGGAFVDAKPVPDETEFDVQRRQRLVIRLSDVATAHLAGRGVAKGFVLLK